MAFDEKLAGRVRSGRRRVKENLGAVPCHRYQRPGTNRAVLRA